MRVLCKGCRVREFLHNIVYVHMVFMKLIMKVVGYKCLHSTFIWWIIQDLHFSMFFFPPSCLHDGFSFQLSYHSDCSCVIRLHINVVAGIENMVFHLLINSLISLFHSREEWTWWRFFPFCSSWVFPLLVGWVLLLQCQE